MEDRRLLARLQDVAGVAGHARQEAGKQGHELRGERNRTHLHVLQGKRHRAPHVLRVGRPHRVGDRAAYLAHVVHHAGDRRRVALLRLVREEGLIGVRHGGSGNLVVGGDWGGGGNGECVWVGLVVRECYEECETG